MQVRDLMSTDVVTVPVGATLADAVRRLLEEGVGSVVVVDGEGDPVGIVTESDALGLALETDDPLSSLSVEAVGHRPVVTTTPSTAVSTVARTMADEGVKKVPVIDGIDLVGMVTLSDVVWHLTELRSELSNAASLRAEWDPT
ncbi:CBS domain-containing protein [Halomicroarcula sp. GCM10025817]|uniref:CBS domain-containing protein n=1 Tax=Haloarcula TaxID=2237 RepID=UPI0023E7B672|nr:CBS domain-containing protein [Halomicroarcula sp. SYNS111]